MEQSKVFVGYHGTDADSAVSILEEKKFLSSGPWRDWLGREICFLNLIHI